MPDQDKPHHGDALRQGETALQGALPQGPALRFIGRIHTPFEHRDDCPRQGRFDGPDCTIEVDPLLAPALDGIDQFETLEILYWLHEARRDLLTQSPKSDGKIRGTFSLRSPLRPNPIGTSRVRLIRREGAVLTVRGLDCLTGTPLVDIKPDRCGYSVQAPPK